MLFEYVVAITVVRSIGDASVIVVLPIRVRDELVVNEALNSVADVTLTGKEFVRGTTCVVLRNSDEVCCVRFVDGDTMGVTFGLIVDDRLLSNEAFRGPDNVLLMY